ncbi:saccharopine dehydrogenase NADP-binding domain-containing protein [Pendulispora rubella]|uniref:Saccharopine dehydrogenase NADP-binding domain-containing protein n=1 Tax=Pendulispora rubella TaxID=2741070 RepID=A0ABZ2LG68_9BACT
MASARADVLVFGATGFTGKLVCDALRTRGVTFAIAGRSRAKLDALSDSLGGVETALVDLKDAETIVRALSGRKVVSACAGPFIDVGEPILASCARMGIHYADTTGEQNFVALAVLRYRATAEASGACVAPSMAYEIAPPDWAAHLAAQRLGKEPDAIDIVYIPRAGGNLADATTRGTKLSVLSIFSGESRQYIDGALRREAPAATVRTFPAREEGGRAITAMSIPSPESIVVPSHTAARTVRTFMAMDKAAAHLLQKARGVAPALARVARPLLVRAIGRTTEGPEGEARGMEFDVLAEARSGDTVKRVYLTGRDPYGLTAQIQALFVERALAGKVHARGVVAPSVAIAPADALAALPLELHERASATTE